MQATQRQGICGGFTAQEFHFGDFTLDQSRYRLQKGERLLRLEKLPMELLILLVQRDGELVSREEIAERLWGKDVFVDIDHSINTAIRKIRLALRDDPEKPRFVETVVGKGYRFAAPVISSNGDSTSQAQPLPLPVQIDPVPTTHPLEARHISVRVWMLLAGVAVLTIFIVALTLFRGRAAKSTRPPPIKSLAVLPLKNLSGDPSQEYLADGMTEELIGRLSAIHDLRVISRTSAMQFKDTKLSAPEIAKALHVDALVEGSVTREGSRVRVHAQLIRGATDEHFWSETYDRDFSDVLALQSDVAQSIAEKVEVTVTGGTREAYRSPFRLARSLRELSQRLGRFDSNSRAGDEESIGYFEEAINQDPTFAPAYLGLAKVYDDLGTFFGGAPPVKCVRR